MKKRVVAFLLSVMLLVGLLPTVAFAAYSGNASPIITSGTVVWKDNKNQIKLVMSNNYANGQELHVGVMNNSFVDLLCEPGAISNIATSIENAMGVYVNIPADAANVQGGTVYADLPTLPMNDDSTAQMVNGSVKLLVWSSGTGTGNWNLSSASDAVVIVDGKGEVTKEDPTADMYTVGAAKTYTGSALNPAITPGTDAGSVTNIYLADDNTGTNKTAANAGQTNAGTYHVFVDVAASTLYNAKTDLYLGTWTINKAAVAGSVTLSRTGTEGAPFAASETVTAGFTAGTPTPTAGDLTYSWKVDGVAVANTGTTYTTTGTEKKIEVSVTAASTSTNFKAPASAISASITGGVPTATAAIADLEYNGAVQTPTITWGNGGSNDNMDVSYDPAEIKNAGSYTASFESKDEELNAPGDVTFNVTKANLTLSVKADASANASSWTLDDVAGSDAKGSDKLADIFGALTVDAADAAVYKDAKNIVTVTFYEKVDGTAEEGECTCDEGNGPHDATNTECTYVPAVPDSYEKITAAPEAGKTYYVDIAVAANTTDLTNYKSVAKTTAGVPADATLAQFTEITFAANNSFIIPSAPVVKGEHTAYMVGRGEGMFAPNGQMTRAEAATILARLTEGFDEDGTYPAAPYSDVEAGAWYAKYINFAADKGIVNGYEDGTFQPNKAITRAELATMIANYVKIAEIADAATVSDVAGHWAEGYIAALEKAQIVKGYEDGTFRPNQAITRAEAATMVNGAIGRVPMDDLDLSLNDYVNPFTDVYGSQWFYENVMEATVDHQIAHFHK